MLNHISSGLPIRIKTGLMEIDPRTAAMILKSCALPDPAGRVQEMRLKSNQARQHVAYFVEQLRTNNWKVETIRFARCGDALYFINGYHRITGVAEYGRRAVWFYVDVIECSTIENVMLAFAKEDRREGSRIRTDGQATDAVGLAGKLGVERSVASALFSASPHLDNGLKSLLRLSPENRAKISSLEYKMDVAAEWREEIAAWNDIVGAARGKIKKKLKQQYVLLVGLATLRYQRSKAIDFWLSVAKNDGLRVGQPAKTLVDALIEDKGIAGNADVRQMIVPTSSWNAYFEKRQQRKIIIENIPALRICGTPINFAFEG